MDIYKVCLALLSCGLPVFFPALDRAEGVSQQDWASMEEFQQRINAFSLEKVKAYYRRLRYTEPAWGLVSGMVGSLAE